MNRTTKNNIMALQDRLDRMENDIRDVQAAHIAVLRRLTNRIEELENRSDKDKSFHDSGFAYTIIFNDYEIKFNVWPDVLHLNYILSEADTYGDHEHHGRDKDKSYSVRKITDA